MGSLVSLKGVEERSERHGGVNQAALVYVSLERRQSSLRPGSCAVVKLIIFVSPCDDWAFMLQRLKVGPSNQAV